MSASEQDARAGYGRAGALRDLPLVCPLCHGALGSDAQGYACRPCDRRYPLHDGIPDFRIFPDPYLGFEDDHRRTDIVLEALPRLALPELLQYYWSHSDITPPALRTQYIRNALRGVARGRQMLATLGNHVAPSSPAPDLRVLEIGSGTGNFLLPATSRYPRVVGTDIGMRWLHLSRRRFMDARQPPPPLVCCCAEYLPFPDGVFDVAVSHSTLEFTRDPARCLAEAARVLGNHGVFVVNTVNRFSLAPNPYVQLWGVGFLPRSWQAPYVRWRRQATYEQVRLLSLGEVLQLARACFPRVEVILPDIEDETHRQLPWATRLQVQFYRAWKRVPVLRDMLKLVAPQWDLLLHKGQN